MSNTVYTLGELEALPLGQWLEDAEGIPWVLFDTNVMVRQRMFRSRDGRLFVAMSEINLPAHLADFVGECEHKKLNIEGWQCARCGAVVNEPPAPPVVEEPEPGRAWFYGDHFGEWCGMSPDFDNIIALAEDKLDRRHDQAARDRFEFEINALAKALDDEESRPIGLGLIVEHLVRRAREEQTR